jgi:hypothetical protein
LKSKGATDAIMKQCEQVLSQMRQVYLDADVPGVIADRHLKKNADRYYPSCDQAVDVYCGSETNGRSVN